MRRDDHLTTSGIVVTIVFGIGITSFVIALIVMKCQERAANKRRKQAERAALLSGKGRSRSDTENAEAYARARSNSRIALNPREGLGMQSEADLPLIAPGGTRSDQQYYPQEYSDQERRASNSGTPPVQPKLHPGLIR